MAGTFTVAFSDQNTGTGRLVRVRIDWVSDASAGTCTPTFNLDRPGYLIAMDTDPGSTAPDDNYDITVTLANGVNLLGGAGADRDTATSERCRPLDVNSQTSVEPAYGVISVNISAAGNSKVGTIDLWFAFP